MGLPEGAEWIVLAVVALLLFGGSRLAGFGKSAGQAIREFKEETRGQTKEDPQPDEPAHPDSTARTDQ
jgi:sec-independent protein translocase protein TatA